MPSFLIQTLGCKLNQLESEAIADAYSNQGYEEAVDNENEPNLIIINTCTVTSKADQKARRVIRKALRDFPDAKIIVTGCYAQLNKDDILKLETDSRQRLSVISKDKIIKQKENDLFQFNPKKFSQHTRSFLKIQDGCDKHCTYCKIRLARGKSASLAAEEVLKRLHVLEETHAEAVLTGVNISQYKDPRFFYHKPHEPHELLLTEKSNLAELLEFLLKGTEKIAIRLSSLAPEIVDEKLVKVLAHPRIRSHFHLSIQSCSDKILEKMGRVYNAQTVENAVNLLRGAKKDPFMACDIITGFPGETETEFDETYNLCKNLKFAWIHVFPFSKREGTPAFSFTDCVTESEVSRRVELFTELAKQGRADYVHRWHGKEVDVLVERERDSATNHTNQTNRLEDKKKERYCNGTSENYLKVLVRCAGEVPAAGSVVRCKLLEAGDFEEYDVAAENLE